jgi:hypothetical protein
MAAKTTKTKTRPRKAPLSDEARATWRKKHGRYIGLLRNLPLKKKAQVKRVFREGGYIPAIKLAKELAAA